MVISVHAISMIYELRALRSRLGDMLQEIDRGALYLVDEEAQLRWCYAICVNLINKVERTGEYIGSLEREVAASAPQEADLGEE